MIPASGAGGPEFKPRNGPLILLLSATGVGWPFARALHLTVKDVVAATSHIDSKAQTACQHHPVITFRKTNGGVR